MSEIRKHPFLDRWVIISSERGKRPGFTKFPKLIKKGGPCPFCEGQESKTPPEIYAVRPKGKPNSAGWKVRVIPNKYPVLKPEDPIHEETHGIYTKVAGHGYHEVIVETADHHKDLHELSIDHIGFVIKTFRLRFNMLKKDRSIKSIQLFKNHGLMGGASLEHTHCQLIALPIVSKKYFEEERYAKSYHQETGRCISCDMIAQEIREKERLVYENDDFIAFCPYAPRFAFETWIIPKRHESHFENLGDELVGALADCLKATLLKLQNYLDEHAYNFMIYTSPVNVGDQEFYHWRMEITPQRTPIAGFERGAGFYTNAVSPETAAEMLCKEDIAQFMK